MRSGNSVNKNMPDGKPSWHAGIFSHQDLIFNEVDESVMQENAIKCFKSEHKIPSHSPNSLTTQGLLYIVISL